MAQPTTRTGGIDGLVGEAHAYVERGWPVLFGEFVADGSGHLTKKPLTRWRLGDEGQKATTNHVVIGEWAARFGSRIQIVGIPTGKASGLVVLDVDPGNGGDEAHLPGPLPDTLTAKTGSGGRHYVFQWQEGMTNASGSLPVGIDVRGEGGYVVVEPSVNPNTGNAYQWVDDGVAVAVAPQWFVDALRAEPVAPAPKATPTVGQPTDRDVKVAQAALDSDCDELASMTKGEDGGRNNALNRMAIRLHRMAVADRLDKKTVRRRLMAAGQESGMTAAECKGTINSAFRADNAQEPSLGPDGDGGVFADEESGDEVLPAIRQHFLANDDKRTDYLTSVMSDDDVMALKDPQFIIDGWIPRGLYTIVYGEPGVKKTFAMLGMYLAVRRGTRWQDHATRKGAALMFEGEGAAQLKVRLKAWKSRYPLRDDQSMEPGGILEEFVDLTKPEGVAAIVRTVRGFETRHGCKVELVIIDPLVEFMTGDENGEGMDKATRGLRALAMYLDIAVVVGHHTNASGERARGADFHRMRSGAFIPMEDLGQDQIGLWQQKQKNAEQVAVIVEAVEHDDSLVLEWVDNLPVSGYVMLKESERRRIKERGNAKEADEKRRRASDMLLAALRKTPGLSQTKLVAATKGNRIGTEYLEQTIAQMVDPTLGLIRVEAKGQARLHYANDAD